MELIKRILVYFFDLVIHRSSAIAYQKQADQNKRDQNNLIKICEGTRYQDKSNMKPKFFLQISDHQQSCGSLI
jgi:hypothetical protein